MSFNNHTKLLTLIGAPLSQSYAYRMQNAAYETAGLSYHYFYTEADDKHLKEIINGIKHIPAFAGCAVTKPNKIKVLEYLDELDPLCQKMGACNTVVKLPDGRLKGYNTDGTGFIKAIDSEINVKDKRIFCFGAGGAGRAICSALAFCGAKEIIITDVISDAAFGLCQDINSNFAPIAKSMGGNDFSMIKECDMLINASGIGMGKTVGKTPLPDIWINKDQFCFDACYNPIKTQFLIDAEK